MFRLDDDSLALAATDLSNHLACPHLSQQQLAMARGERARPPRDDDPHLRLIQQRGDLHEQDHLRVLAAEVGGYLDLTSEPVYAREGLIRQHGRAVEAMGKGERLIYQPTLFGGQWQGRVDFLRRIEKPSDLGGYSYEVLDTKLARHVKPAYVHQLMLYSELVAAVQGVRPQFAHVILGDGTTEPIFLPDYAALHRHVASSLESVAAAPALKTYPEPVSHCGICDLRPECRRRLVADDHLSLVAGAHRRRREKLGELRISTGAGLAGAPADLDARSLGVEQYAWLRTQAQLQVESRESGEPVHKCLEPARAAGLALLPDPSPGDVFFDLEGDPYVGAEGVEYLWGWWTADRGYECVWAHGPDEERAALEAFIYRVAELRRQHPAMHIYHYAPHERSKLRSLSVKYATREDEVDQLLREGAFVDLLAVVRQGVQVGEESYSLKKLERHHGFDRQEDTIREGGG